MFSNPIDSSTDKSTSSGTTPDATVIETSNSGVGIVSWLSKSIESKLPVSELDIDPETSPQLENIKVETNRIGGETFKTLMELHQAAKSYHSKLQDFRSKVENNEPVPADIFGEQGELMTIDGVGILHNHRKVISRQVGFVEQAWDDMDLRIRGVFKESEDAQYWQGHLNAAKHYVFVGLAAFHISGKLDKKMKALGILDKSLRGDVVVAIQTKIKLQEYLEADEQAIVLWEAVCDEIYNKKAAEKGITTLQSLKIAEELMLELISPIRVYLVQIYACYASGITVVKEAKLFCDAVPEIIRYLNSIDSAKSIIRNSHRFKYENTVNELGRAIYEHLESMKILFTQRPLDPATIERFIEDETATFMKSTAVAIHDLDRILEKHTSSSKSKDAEKKRMADDRCYNSTVWRNRPSVNPEGVRARLKNVNAAIDAIYRMSVASLGKTLKTIDGGIERSHIELDVTNSSLGRVHQVLNEDVEEGLKHFQNLQMVEKPSLIQRALDHMPFHHKEF